MTPRKIDPRHMAVVHAIVEHGTFNKAAEALDLSQPALSKAISLLEHRVGVKIFDRGARGSVLTEAGRIVARGAQNMNSLLARTEAEISFRSHGISGPFNVGATPSMMLDLVPAAVARLSNDGLPLAFTLLEGLDDRLMAALQCGEIDLLIGPVESLHGCPVDLVEIKFADDCHFVGFRPGHPLSSSKGLYLKDLESFGWVLPTGGSSYFRWVEALFLAAALPWPRDCISTNSLPALQQILGLTERVTILTGVHVRNASPIVTVPLIGSEPRHIGVKRRKNFELPGIAELFLQYLQELICEPG